MRIAIILESKHKHHIDLLKPVLKGHYVLPILLPISISKLAIIKLLKERKIDGIISCSPRLLKIVLDTYHSNTFQVGKNEDVYKPYWGAMFQWSKIPMVFIPEIDKIYNNKTAKHLINHYCQKIIDPKMFMHPPKFDWTLCSHDLVGGKAKLDKWYKIFQTAKLIALDIETKPVKLTKEFYENNPLANGLVSKKLSKRKKGDPWDYTAQIITCVGFCAMYEEGGKIKSHSVVIPYEGRDNYNEIKRFCNLKAPKVMQNGKYDVTHLLVNNIPIANWTMDTYGIMHSFLVELPRSLEFIAGYTTIDYMYWKDESGTNLYEYNAKDCHATLWACVQLTSRMEDYVKSNYAENFPKIFPCITCALEGFRKDEELFQKTKLEYEGIRDKWQKKAEIVFGPGFNANSSPQVTNILKLFGMRGAKSSDAKHQAKFEDIGPIQKRLISYVKELRKYNKLLSTYFNFAFLGDRYLYDLDPFGTTTSRFASKSSSLWVGQQVQNFPLAARHPYIADIGWELNAADNGQSESRCTAYMSEDKNLMHAVETAKDFHKHNASMFFGIPVEEITAIIRQLGKKVGHGANYNMGVTVLIESMGSKNVYAAGRLLGLPSSWDERRIAEYLLDCFDKAYPDIRGKYYDEVIAEIESTGRLTGPTGWVRVCFGDPRGYKPDLNAYVAHGPQSLSVKIINAAFVKAWYQYQIVEKVARFKCQIHDELIFQTRPQDTKYVVDGVAKIMAAPTLVRGRQMIIPNDPFRSKVSWGELH